MNEKTENQENARQSPNENHEHTMDVPHALREVLSCLDTSRGDDLDMVAPHLIALYGRVADDVWLWLAIESRRAYPSYTCDGDEMCGDILRSGPLPDQ